MLEELNVRSKKLDDVLQAYLAYIQARGFTSMFIWACPPLQVRCTRPLLWLYTSHILAHRECSKSGGRFE